MHLRRSGAHGSPRGRWFLAVILDLFPLTTDPASCYFPYSVLTMALFAAVAVYGFVVALGNRPTFKDWVLD